MPDARGRTGLDQAGRDLTGNPDVLVRDVELLAASWHVLRRTTYGYRHADGRWTTEQRETYDRGNGATILLYDLARRTVLLTRQFRFPAYVNGHPDGLLVETAAGLLDGDDPATAIRRETAEELGVTVGELEHVFDLWMSPGSVTEQLHFYAAPYTPTDAPAPVAASPRTAKTSRSSSSTPTTPCTRSAPVRSPAVEDLLPADLAFGGGIVALGLEVGRKAIEPNASAPRLPLCSLTCGRPTGSALPLHACSCDSPTRPNWRSWPR